MRVAGFAVGRSGDLLVTVGLGSCVVIVLHDPRVGVGGLAHVLLPEPAVGLDRSNPFKFASTAVPALAREVCAIGGSERHLEARLIGGSTMFAALAASGGQNVGERNVEASRAALALARIPINGEDVGGDWGRSVHYDVRAGAVRVKSVLRTDVTL